MSTDDALLDRARAGDEPAFADLVAPYRRELHVHCYRMLGSFEDADDAVQETLLAAWRGLATFQARSSVRTWLYRIATNTCLNLIRGASRRPPMVDTLPPTAPQPSGSDTVTWLQPYPDSLLDALPDATPGPDAQVEQYEAVSLAFVTALQVLSPRARAVLILRDVLGFTTREVAATLDTSEEAVAMTLSRARTTLRAAPGALARRGGSDPANEADVVRRLVAAFTSRDVDRVVSLLAEDVRIAMPPLPAVWQGRQRAAQFMSGVVFHLVPQARFIITRANRQPALAVYTRDDTNGAWHANGLLVITLHGDRVAALTRFESHTLRPFGLPRILPVQD
ncbi:RNA polymerase subunit sigma-70 [Actinoplanes subtropicus]|uniref:RNA polymerase subunit sigma-70 n=1 Tax=Actinoplanes subtropicus TaxID=543632 RepID=UPI0004C2B925|nr:RNA polymerase subunit sigma-70 [Actinoplanes subtropicus]